MGCGAGAQRRYEQPNVTSYGIRTSGGTAQKANASATSSTVRVGSKNGAEGLQAVRVGSQVRLQNLKASPDLNGAYAAVVSYDPAVDRWTVRLMSGVEKAVKAENMVVAPVKVGGRVQIFGLQADTALNGLNGVVENYDERSGHWTVKLSSGMRKAFHHSNLMGLFEEATLESAVAEEYEPGAFEVLGDSPLYKALKVGNLRLVRGSYFERRAADGQPWQRHQDVAEEHIWAPDEAAELWASYGSAFLIAVSYPWLTREHPDPESWHLKRLARVLREWRLSVATAAFRERICPNGCKSAPSQGPPDVGVFVDYCCLEQKQGGGPVREDVRFLPCIEVMGMLYGHRHTSVFRMIDVPGRIEKKYFHRGWTAFESCVADNKALPNDKVYDFDESYDPESEPASKSAFLRKFKHRQAPPISYETFCHLILRLEDEVKGLRVPYNRLFTMAADKECVLGKFQQAWEEQRKVQELDFKSMGWLDADVLQLASSLPSFPHLETLHLTGNKISNGGAEAIMAASLNTGLRSLDLSDNGITEAGAVMMSNVLGSATSLTYLYVFANPFCAEEEPRQHLINAWTGAGKSPADLVLDHFALNHKR